MSQSPKVSVCIITYNHERFIEQAVESVLCQKTDFDFEIVVGEDCSTDQTRQRLLALQTKHPDRIRLLLRERNLGMLPNFVETYHSCRGEYTALLEGDDYWTSDEKLARQVEYLDSHPECSVCCHITDYVNEKGRLTGDTNPPSGWSDFTLKALILRNFMQTCSVVLRRSSLPTLPEWMRTIGLPDWPLHVQLANRGAIGFLPEHWAAYRIHSQAAWSGTEVPHHVNVIRHYLPMLEQEIGPEYAEEFEAFRRWHSNYLIGCLLKVGNFHGAVNELVDEIVDRHSRLTIPHDQAHLRGVLSSVISESAIIAQLKEDRRQLSYIRESMLGRTALLAFRKLRRFGFWKQKI